MKKLSIWVLAFLPLVATAVAYPFLPETVPTHWNISGEVDGWGSRSSLLFLALISPACFAGMEFLPKIDPKRENYKKFDRGYTALELCLVLMFLLMQGITLYSSLAEAPLDISRIMLCTMGLLFCVIGNFMPKFRHNYFCGFKTPWTLASETVWDKTHRLGGVLWFWAGLISFVCGLVLPVEFAFIGFMVIILLASAVPLVYSWWVWKQEQTK